MEPEINQWLVNQGNGSKLHLPLWPAGKKFAVCLTHDVDFVTQGLSRQRLRQCKNLMGFLVRNGLNHDVILKSFAGMVSRSAACLASSKNSSRIFDEWLTVEAKYGFKSTFFFLPERVSVFHPFDGPLYRYLDRVEFEGQVSTVAEVMREIDRRGWEVGLHGAYYSYDDAEELKREKEQIERRPGKRNSQRPTALSPF